MGDDHLQRSVSCQTWLRSSWQRIGRGEGSVDDRSVQIDLADVEHAPQSNAPRKVSAD